MNYFKKSNGKEKGKLVSYPTIEYWLTFFLRLVLNILLTSLPHQYLDLICRIIKKSKLKRSLVPENTSENKTTEHITVKETTRYSLSSKIVDDKGIQSNIQNRRH